MKKRILAFTLIFAMLFSMAIIPTMAETTPNVLCQPAGRTKLQQKAIRPMGQNSFSADLFAEYKSNIISAGLSANLHYGPNQKVKDPETNTTVAIEDVYGFNNELAKYQEKWSDITQGVSFIGATSVANNETAEEKGGLSKLVDGTWSSSSVWQDTKLTVDMTARYDVNGQFDTDDDATNNDDFRYIAMLTFNFGKVKEIKALSYLTDNVNNVPSAADIYVSNDGQNWKLVDYYDRLEGRANLSSYENGNSAGYGSITTNSGDYLWKDGGDRSVKAWWIFNLTNVQQAQYVRVAYTVGNTNIDGSAGAGGFTDIKALETEEARKEAAYTVGKGALATQWVLPEIMVHGGDVAVETVAAQCSKLDNDGTYDARLVTKVSKSIVGSALPTKINFKISAVYEQGDVATDNTVAAKTYSTTTVCETISAGEGTYSAEGYYLALFTIKDIPENVKVTFTITPEIEYANGVKVTGEAVTYTPNGAYTPDEPQA